jgi:hypothetical protein
MSLPLSEPARRKRRRTPLNVERVEYSVREWAAMHGFSTPHAYKLIEKGLLDVVDHQGRLRVTAEADRKFEAARPKVVPGEVRALPGLPPRTKEARAAVAARVKAAEARRDAKARRKAARAERQEGGQ